MPARTHTAYTSKAFSASAATLSVTITSPSKQQLPGPVDAEVGAKRVYVHSIHASAAVTNANTAKARLQLGAATHRYHQPVTQPNAFYWEFTPTQPVEADTGNPTIELRLLQAAGADAGAATDLQLTVVYSFGD